MQTILRLRFKCYCITLVCFVVQGIDYFHDVTKYVSVVLPGGAEKLPLQFPGTADSQVVAVGTLLHRNRRSIE